LAFLVFAGWFVTSADANHAWGKYHWDRSTEDTEANPLILGNNFSTSDWDGALSVASTDWNGSVLKNAVLQGNSNSDCDPTNGQVELCNGEYGENGWLGIASIWATRGKSNHIVQGVVMVNDTYFSMPSYNSQSWRDFVVCQEVGHTFGLDHQDENFSNPNRGSCMDYTSDPDGSILDQLDNRHPNDHDYEMMAEIYAHLNSTDDGGSGSGNGKGNGNGKKPDGVGVDIDLTDPTQWGQAIRQDALGRNSLFERTLPNGQVLVTHVIWTLEAD
jgi:hypothetical protein